MVKIIFSTRKNNPGYPDDGFIEEWVTWKESYSDAIQWIKEYKSERRPIFGRPTIDLAA